MFPVLFHIGSIPIHAYGLMIAIGFLCTVATMEKLSDLDGLPASKMMDLVFWCFVLGLAGARAYYVVTHWSEFEGNIGSIFKVWEGGLVFYGGPIAALPFATWFVIKNKIPFWKAADVSFPSLTIAHAFGRIGCFGAGCCYGRPTSSFLGMRFNSEQVEPALRGIPIHPTQLYEAVALFVLFAMMIFLHAKKRKEKSWDGQVALTYFLAYPLIRLLVESFRGDPARGFLLESWIPGGVSWGQFTSVVLFVIAVVVAVFRLKQIQKAQGQR